MRPFHEFPPSLAAEIEEFAAAVEAYQSGRLDADAFKAKRVGFGVYEQRRKGAFMVRVRCTGGALLPGQLRALAAIARRRSAAPLHMTTRQELQIHGVAAGELAGTLRDLYAAGLSTRGGGGNGVRNVVAPWDAGIAPGECFDVLPYAVALVDRMACDTASWQLPRKYKMAFAGSGAGMVDVLTADLGFAACERGGQRGFAVYVAGGMGKVPAVGRLLHEFLPADEVYLAAEAVKRVLRKHGNYADRNRARLRFLWQDLGRDAFLARYQEEREALRGEADWRLVPARLPCAPGAGPAAHPTGPEGASAGAAFAAWRQRLVTPQAQPGLYAVLLPLAAGTLDVAAAEAVADFAAGLGEDALRGTREQNLVLRHVPESELTRAHALADRFFPLSRQARLLGTCTACTGAATCALGLCRASSALEAILARLTGLGEMLDRCGDVRLAISGCPNACGHHLLADLGFCGRVGRCRDAAYPAYAVFAGARLVPESPRFAQPLGEVPARVLPEFVASVLEACARDRRPGEPFPDYLDRAGEAAIRALCDRHRTPPDPAQGPEFYQDWGAAGAFRSGAGPR